MYHVNAQGVEERMINVHYYYYYSAQAKHKDMPKPNSKVRLCFLMSSAVG